MSDKLPYGTWQRRFVLWLVAPFLVMLILYWIINSLLMPTITRHGEEFALSNYVDQGLVEVQLKLEELGLG